MRSLAEKAWRLLPRLELSDNGRRTFRFHLAYAVLDGATGGILLNAPFVALKAMGGQNWQLPLREAYGGIGMLATLYLGSWMATRRKMPFVFLPGMLAGLCVLTMSLAMGSAFWFLTFLGMGAMFEIVTRPATAAILRTNYPVAQRGRATGIVRSWSSLSFVLTNLLSAYLLQKASNHTIVMVQAQCLFAAIVGLVGFFCFRQIRVNEDSAEDRSNIRLEIVKNLRNSISVIVYNGRFRRYVFGCFLDGFFGMLYLPLIWAFLGKSLQFDYVWCAALVHAIPTTVAFATTGWLGPWFDRSNPWVAWAWIRFLFAIDALLLAATPLAAVFLPSMVFVLPVLGRILRGSVQGGWWVMWWQLGVTHFAPPGEDTSRYTGIMVFLNGATRLLGSLAGMLLAALSMQPETLLVIGGVGVLLSGIYSLSQAARERQEHRPETFAQFESQYGDKE
jgi:hypothetical protein